MAEQLKIQRRKLIDALCEAVLKLPYWKYRIIAWLWPEMNKIVRAMEKYEQAIEKAKEQE